MFSGVFAGKTKDMLVLVEGSTMGTLFKAEARSGRGQEKGTGAPCHAARPCRALNVRRTRQRNGPAVPPLELPPLSFDHGLCLAVFFFKFMLSSLFSFVSQVSFP